MDQKPVETQNEEELQEMQWAKEGWRPTLIVLIGALVTVLFQYVIQPASPEAWVFVMLVAVAVSWSWSRSYAIKHYCKDK